MPRQRRQQPPKLSELKLSDPSAMGWIGNADPFRQNDQFNAGPGEAGHRLWIGLQAGGQNQKVWPRLLVWVRITADQGWNPLVGQQLDQSGIADGGLGEGVRSSVRSVAQLGCIGGQDQKQQGRDTADHHHPKHGHAGKWPNGPGGARLGQGRAPTVQLFELAKVV